MTSASDPELFWLLMTVGLTGLLFTPYVVRLMIEHSPWRVWWDSASVLTNQAGWALRAKRAHYNAVENLVVFAPLVLMVQVLAVSSPLTATAASLYFFARLGHFLVYTAAVPVIRTVLFLLGFGCQAALFAHLLGWA